MVIGITGGIGSGKSAVSDYLRSIGETVICADEIARQVVQPGELGAMQIKRVFGDSFFDESGNLLRGKLADHVFSDKARLDLLNDTLHPIIIDRFFKLSRAHSGRVFWDVALLIQADMQQCVNFIWLIVADEAERIRRVVGRDGIAEQSVRDRVDKQLRDEQMTPFADELITNDTDLPALYAQLEKLLSKPIYNEVDK